jgi:hypothetical protein
VAVIFRQLALDGEWEDATQAVQYLTQCAAPVASLKNEGFVSALSVSDEAHTLLSTAERKEAAAAAAAR